MSMPRGAGIPYSAASASQELSHLEIIVDRLLREFKVEANVGKPQISYKETV